MSVPRATRFSPDLRWEAAWALVEQYRATLLRIATTGARVGTLMPGDEAEDVLHAFMLDRAPHVARIVEALPSEQRAAYVVAAFRNFVRRTLRARRRQERALEYLAIEFQFRPPNASEPDGAGEVDGRLLNEWSLREVLAGPRGEAVAAQAAAMYFGIRGAPQSLRQIAQALKLSRYAARIAVLDGLMIVTLQLAQGGGLSSSEAEACRLLVVEGWDPESVARAVRLTRHQVRRALERARAVLAQAL